MAHEEVQVELHPWNSSKVGEKPLHRKLFSNVHIHVAKVPIFVFILSVCMYVHTYRIPFPVHIFPETFPHALMRRPGVVSGTLILKLTVHKQHH